MKPRKNTDTTKLLPVAWRQVRKAIWNTFTHAHTLHPGDRSCAPVGHSCSYQPPAGGAERQASQMCTPQIRDLATLEGLLPHSKHAGFVLSYAPHSVWVFGGLWDHARGEQSPTVPKTIHTSSEAIGNQLYIFVGGKRGTQPMQDVKLHVFDANTLTWLPVHGACFSLCLCLCLSLSLSVTIIKKNKHFFFKKKENFQSPGHGHVVVAAGTKLFIHGGLAGDRFYDDQKLSLTGAPPTGCTVLWLWGNTCIIFGGVTPTGALDTIWIILCVIPWPVMCNSEKKDSNSVTLNCDMKKGASTESQANMLFCIVLGKMNREGEI
ncbi:unnamed protein product [Nyctereutes procyonoides]|uniref:Rab9 effector protein with kelch motifs n=1 Tax=Nyctereutes procyonoides TaxID=34880 RepID=A0A811YD17_NYCPR|nr:unnamed protein product [Nyctereutes procyonoides]